MLLTPRLGLRKPENVNAFGQDDFNFNMDLLDVASVALPGWILSHSLAISCANGAWTNLPMDTEHRDTDGFHAGSDATITIPAGLGGFYVFGYHFDFASNATGIRHAQLLTDATGQVQETKTALGGAEVTSMGQTTMRSLAAGTTLFVRAFQNSGGALNVRAVTAWSPYFWGVKVA